MTEIHQTASAGFGAQADAYVRGRPDYPQEVTTWLERKLDLGPGKTALDLGAGTGKFTRRLLETGATVIAVEPVAAMRAQLHAVLPQVEVREGSAEALPLADASVDAVVCAQAFHWFATPAALKEMHRVLKLGGALGLIWNIRDESVDWVARLTQVMARYEGDTPRYQSQQWREPFASSLFSPLEETIFPYVHVGPAEQVIVDRVRSVSFIAALPPDEHQRVVDELRQIIAHTPALAGQPTVTFPYRTMAFSCRKLS